MNANFFNHDNAIFSAGGILVDENNKKVLIIRRADSDEYLLPKGKLDGDESPKYAAQREIFEEIGYENEVKEIIRVQVRPDIHDETKHRIVFWFYSKLTSPKKHSDTQMENENFVQEWVDFDTAIEKLNWEDDKEFVRVIKEKLKVC